MRAIKSVFYAALVAIIIAISIAAVRTMHAGTAIVHVDPVEPPAIDRQKAAEHLARAVQFKTVSFQDPKQSDRSTFTGLHAYLEATFPKLHRTLSREIVGDASLLYTWKGSDPSLKPILLMAHQDVVPADVETESAWTQPAFSGAITDGFIWGRGTMDDKGALLGVFEAIEMLIGERFQPRRTVMFASGADEEVGGATGAAQIAALLKTRGIEVEYVLDEGGGIIKGMIPGVSAPVATIGIAEKGYVSVELIVAAKGGHSSIPPRHGAIGQLSRALYRLEEHPFPAHFGAIERQMLESLAPAARMPIRAVFANTWLFGPVIAAQLARTPATNAAIRTSTAETIIHGGVKENVLPTEARAVVNFRILPGDTVSTVTEHVRSVIDDADIKMNVLPDVHDPSPVSSTATMGFQTISKTIRQVYPEVPVVAPYLVLGATDSRHYAVVTPNIYRFNPQISEPRDLERIHGINERVSVDDHARSIGFYMQLIRNSDQ